jgi:hypothetical protein
VLEGRRHAVRGEAVDHDLRGRGHRRGGAAVVPAEGADRCVAALRPGRDDVGDRREVQGDPSAGQRGAHSVGHRSELSRRELRLLPRRGERAESRATEGLDPSALLVRGDPGHCARRERSPPGRRRGQLRRGHGAPATQEDPAHPGVAHQRVRRGEVVEMDPHDEQLGQLPVPVQARQRRRHLCVERRLPRGRRVRGRRRRGGRPRRLRRPLRLGDGRRRAGGGQAAQQGEQRGSSGH